MISTRLWLPLVSSWRVGLTPVGAPDLTARLYSTNPAIPQAPRLLLLVDECSLGDRIIGTQDKRCASAMGGTALRG